MATIKFFLQSKKNPATIYIRFSIGRGLDFKSKTRYCIDPNNWSLTKGKPKLNNVELKILDENLSSLKKSLNEHYNRSVANGIELNSNWFKEFILPTGKNDPNQVPDKLIPFIDYFINTKAKAGVVQQNTIKSYKVYKKRIQSFQEYEKEEFLVCDINQSFQARFNDFSNKFKYGKNGTARIVKFLKQIGNNAASHGIKTHIQLNSIKNTFDKDLVIALNTEDVNKLSNVILHNESLDNARDWLLIGIETGQRVSDYLKFEKSNVEYNSQHDTKFVKFVQRKTKKNMYIPLSPKVLRILEKREGNFPRKISSQKFNEYIKQVAKIAGLDEMIEAKKMNPETHRFELGIYPKYELISSKIARKTFCTKYYGIKPISEIMMMSGHTTEKSLRVYIGQTDIEQQKILKNFFQNTNQ